MTAGSRKLAVRLGLSLGVAAAFVWWLHNQGIEIVPSASRFAAVAWWTIPAYVLTLLVVHFLRAYRWIYLLRPIAGVPVRKMLPVAFVGFLAILVLPLRTGELARPFLIKRHAGVSGSAALGTIAIERVVDGLLVSLWLTLCLFGVPAETSPYVWPLRLLPLGLFLAALAFLLAFLRRSDLFVRLAERLARPFSRRLADTVVHVLEGFGRGLAVLPNRMALLRFLVVSVLYWAINALGVWLLAWGCGLDVGLLGAVATMAVVAVGILLPSGPGFFGNFQAAVLVAIGLYLPAAVVAQRADAFIFALYLCQVGVTLLVGFASLVLGRVSLRGVVSSGLPQVATEDLSEWS
ncbi:MAG: flippase-like domain-containing protein [Deltaproteobacteria bacterium]|nr:flippase-like domain-containing protein [Deltaproteobacteria bacterium]